jgi:hypothetical protein
VGVILSILGALGVGGVIGGFVTQIMTTRRETAARRTAFKKQQLEQFYGPLLAAHKEIRARSELRVKLQQAIDASHFEDMVLAGPDGVEGASDKHVPAIVANVDDEHKTFRHVLMPSYREMISTFRNKMWLTEPQTRDFFPSLIEFVDVWDKIIDRRLPHAVAATIGHTEENLKPFYEHLEQVHDRLRSEIS